MASTYSNLKIQLMATGENAGTWGNVTNDNLGAAIEQALVETALVTFSSDNQTLTLSDSNTRQAARALRLNLTGTTAGARDLIVPAIQKPYIVNNGTADTITVKVSGQTGVAVPAGASMLLYNNGTDVGVAFNRVVANVVGNVTGNVTGNLTGTASNATVLQTARNIQISGGATAANVSFDGSAAVDLNVTAINVDAATAGTLAAARGGTGATTLNSEAVVIGNATGAVKFVEPGTSGNVLTSNGTAWASVVAPAPNTTNVLAATAGATEGNVGTYASLIQTDSTTARIPGYTTNGSVLSWAGAGMSYYDSAGNYSSLSGTWKLMGYRSGGSAANGQPVTGVVCVWLRTA